MPALSQPAAEFWNSTANAALVLGAIIVLAGTWGAFWTSNMKEFYSNERIAANEATAASANAGAANANERAAILEKQAADARERAAKLEADAEQTRLTLQIVRQQAELSERALSPRIIDHDKFLAALGGKANGRVRIEFASGDRENFAVATQLIAYLPEAGWTVVGQPRQIDAGRMGPRPMQPIIFGQSPSGSMNLANVSTSNIDIIAHEISGVSASNLCDALGTAGVGANLMIMSGSDTPDVLVRIGSRLN